MTDPDPTSHLDRADESDPFGPDLELVAQLLAAGQTHAEAGLAVGRSAKFVQRALADTVGFKARIIELKEQRAVEAAAALGALLPEAVDATRRALTSEKVADQLRAASLIFDQFRSFRSDSAAAERMAELRAEIDGLSETVATLSAPSEALRS